jgi:hypothetical protein
METTHVTHDQAEIPGAVDSIEQLRRWTWPFLELPVHGQLRYQIDMAMSGKENALVVGPRGAGKSAAMTHLLEQVRTRDVDGALADVLPRQVVWYTSGQARGARTALIDLADAVGCSLSSRMQRSATPRQVIAHILQIMMEERYHLVCVDEAQLISPDNVELLRLVLDEAAAEDYPLGMILVGDERLPGLVASIGQRGQRFSAEVRVPRIMIPQIEPHLPRFHPHLGLINEQLSRRAWRTLVEELFRAVGGTWRRLRVVLVNANDLALRKQRPIDEEILRLAIEKLASEN